MDLLIIVLVQLMVMGWFIRIMSYFNISISTDNYGDKFWSIPMLIISVILYTIFGPYYEQHTFYWRIGIIALALFSFLYLTLTTPK
jgi:hypothetical protein